MAKKPDPDTAAPAAAPALESRASGTVTVVLKQEHEHRGLTFPAGAKLDLLPRQAAALKAAGVAL